MINNLISKKIGEPLEKLIHTCKLIESQQDNLFTESKTNKALVLLK